MGGGAMGATFEEVKNTHHLNLANYIKYRVGDDILNPHPTPKIALVDKITLAKIGNKFLNLYLKCVRLLVPKSLRDEIFIDTSIGERHKWLYDRYSLPRLLQSCGFGEVVICAFNTSQIENFNHYLLDINPDNSPYKGVSSIYVECKANKTNQQKERE